MLDDYLRAAARFSTFPVYSGRRSPISRTCCSQIVAEERRPAVRLVLRDAAPRDLVA